MACHILFQFFLKYITNSEGMVSSWCVTSKFTLKNAGNIALPWQRIPTYRSHIVHCLLVLLLPWHVIQSLGIVSRSDNSRQVLNHRFGQPWDAALCAEVLSIYGHEDCHRIAQNRHSKVYAPYLVESEPVFKHCVSSDLPQCWLTPLLNRPTTSPVNSCLTVLLLLVC